MTWKNKEAGDAAIRIVTAVPSGAGSEDLRRTISQALDEASADDVIEILAAMTWALFANISEDDGQPTEAALRAFAKDMYT